MRERGEWCGGMRVNREGEKEAERNRECAEWKREYRETEIQLLRKRAREMEEHTDEKHPSEGASLHWQWQV